MRILVHCKSPLNIFFTMKGIEMKKDPSLCVGAPLCVCETLLHELRHEITGKDFLLGTHAANNNNAHTTKKTFYILLSNNAFVLFHNFAAFSLVAQHTCNGYGSCDWMENKVALMRGSTLGSRRHRGVDLRQRSRLTVPSSLCNEIFDELINLLASTHPQIS